MEQLTTTLPITKEQFEGTPVPSASCVVWHPWDSRAKCVGTSTHAARHTERFRRLQRLENTNLIVVMEEAATGRLVASGTIAIELKFVHSCGQVGHIEDIVCDAEYRGKQLGRRYVPGQRREGQESTRMALTGARTRHGCVLPAAQAD